MAICTFVRATDDLASAIPGTYDAVLVALSYVVAAAACYAGLLMKERVGAAESRRERWAWLAGGAFVMGHGVWAMHFTGMLAFELPTPVSYDFWITTLSVVPAVLASGLAIHLISGRAPSVLQLALGGAAFGAGVGIMHYTGMHAMIVDADMVYSPALFGLSIAVAVALGIAALYAQDLRRLLQFRVKGNPLRPFSAAIMGAAIAGMHFTAMAGVYFIPAVRDRVQHTDLSGDTLVIEVAVVSFILIALAAAAAVVDRRLKSSAQQVRLTRQRMVEAIESLTDGFVLFDQEGALVMCNSVFRQMYPTMNTVLKPGTSYESVLIAWARARQANNAESDNTETYVADCLRRFRQGLPMADAPGEDRLQDGRWIYIRQRSVESGGLVGVWSDVTPIKNLQEIYERQANHDSLTGLPNRNLFTDRLDGAAARARRRQSEFALLYIDIDGFKPINDTHGHDAGDVVLKEIAERLKRIMRETDTVARLGGDEFAIIVEPDGTEANAKVAAERIIKTLTQPIRIGDIRCTVGASVGICVAGAEAIDVGAILQRADARMYAAKKAGGNTYRIDGD